MSTVCFCGRVECAAVEFSAERCLADALKRLDASRAEVAMLREALDEALGLVGSLVGSDLDSAGAVAAVATQMRNALASTSDSWLREHDQALAMRVADAVQIAAARGAFAKGRTHAALVAIVKEVVGE